MPDLNSIMKRVREERRQRENAADAALAANGKVDFITAARRAAQLAAAESEQLQKGATKRTGKKKSSVGDMIQRQRKPILMAIGAVMIAMAGLQIGSAFLNRDEPVETAIDTVPPQIDTTATENTSAPADEIAAKIASDTTPALEQSAPQQCLRLRSRIRRKLYRKKPRHRQMSSRQRWKSRHRLNSLPQQSPIR